MQDLGLTIGIIGGLFGVVGVTVSIVLGVAAYRRAKTEAARTAKQDVRQDCAADTTMQMDVKYIVRSVDEIKLEQRAVRGDIDGMKERITRVEESTKSAHKRLDDLPAAK